MGHVVVQSLTFSISLLPTMVQTTNNCAVGFRKQFSTENLQTHGRYGPKSNHANCDAYHLKMDTDFPQ
jgi:hypothetical protein